MILQETKITVLQLVEIINKSKLHCEVMGEDATGTTGGIAILSNPNEIILDSWTSMNIILTGMGRIVGMKERVIISWVYGLTPREKRTSSTTCKLSEETIQK